MNDDRLLPVATDRKEWTTPQVAEFMGVSRQAINRRIHNRTLLGYRDKAITRFPAWQFDVDTRWLRPEVEELLEALGDEVTPRDAARWSTTRVPKLDHTPAELLLSPDGKELALELARRYDGRDTSPTPAETVSPSERQASFEWFPDNPDDDDPPSAILRAAIKLFAQKGPAKVSLREVAAAADVSYSLIYRFFKTKENLLVSVMQLFIQQGGQRLSDEDDVYIAIEKSLGSDAGQYGRMLSWAVLDGATPERLFPAGTRTSGYRTQIEALWRDPRKPVVRDQFDPRVVASLIQLVAIGWDLYEPYMTRLEGSQDRATSDRRDELIEMLKVLVYATSPKH